MPNQNQTAAPQRAIERATIVSAARSWLGTPYHHQASLRGVGADCLGVLRGVWRDLYGFEAERPPAYTRDWAEALDREDLIAAAARHLMPVAAVETQPGDVLLFRMRRGAPAKHVGILTSATTFVHAIEGAPACEISLQDWWRRRIAAAYAFPGVID